MLLTLLRALTRTSTGAKLDGPILRTHRKTLRRFVSIQQSRDLLTVCANLYAGNFKISRTPRSPKVELVLLLRQLWIIWLRRTKKSVATGSVLPTVPARNSLVTFAAELLRDKNAWTSALKRVNASVSPAVRRWIANWRQGTATLWW